MDNPPDRRQRVAEALEKQFERCDMALENCFLNVRKRGYYEEFDLKNIQSLMKVSAQLAAAIARLERHAPAPSPPAENSENRGSIPQ